MSYAICTKCGAEVRWRATKGTRLANFRSRCCGVPLKGKTAGRVSDTKGRMMTLCEICQKRRLTNVIRPDYAFEYTFIINRGWYYERVTRVFAAGTPICSYHWTERVEVAS